jgi:tetratricopeptide (TPR) repeat protein
MTVLRRIALPCALALASVVTAVALPRAAHAQDQGLEQARREFERGNVLFEKGDFQGAADAFMAAYQAKSFPAFLYNAAVCYEKQKDLKQAVELFKRYLKEEPKASDRADVEKRIKALEDEIQRQAAPPTTQPDGTATPPPAAPVLPAIKPKGLVVIDSKPQGATIYLDSKKGGALGETPWSGSLEGDHTIIIENKGYKTEKKKISPRSDKFIELYFALSTEQYLGWIEVKSNVPGSDVFIDSKDVGAVGKTPYMGNIQPGKRKIWVVKEGYTEVEQTVNIEAGKAHNVSVKLEEAAVGFVRIAVNETGTGARVKLDGKEVCAKAPCRFQAPEGNRTISVSRGGKKTMAKNVTIVKRTETTLTVKLAPKPSRGDAFWPFFFSAALAGGGYYGLTVLAEDETDQDKKDIYTYGSYGAFGASGLFFLTGCWYLIRDKGPPSTATVQSRDVSWAPSVGPGFAGVTLMGGF